MTRRIETPAPSLAACIEIVDRLVPELASSLRWLAEHPGCGAMLVIEGFVRDGELLLVADMPGEPGEARCESDAGRPAPAREEPRSRRPTFRRSVRPGLLRFALPLTGDGRKVPQSIGAHRASRISVPSQAPGRTSSA